MHKPLLVAVGLLLPAVCAAEPLQGFTPELRFGAGLFGTGYAYDGVSGRNGQPYLHLEGAAQLAFGPVIADLSGIGLGVFSDNGSLGSLDASLRVGAQFEHVRFLLGPGVNASPGSGAQWFPSATVEAGAGDLRGILGLFDRGSLVPLRLGVGYRDWVTVSYLPELGLEATGRVPVNEGLTFYGRAFASWLARVESFDVVVGIALKLPGGEP
jgi:hypothetical protein